MPESYNTGISIIQGIPRGSCAVGVCVCASKREKKLFIHNVQKWCSIGHKPVFIVLEHWKVSRHRPL